MRYGTVFVSAVVVVAGVGLAVARPGGRRFGPPGPPPIGPGHRILAALDIDQDGELSAEELEAATESLLTLDKNADGRLSPEDLVIRPEGDGPEVDSEDEASVPDHPGLMRHDEDGDGVVSLDEFLAPAVADFERFDTNADAVIDADEAAAAPPPPPPHPRMFGGPRARVQRGR